MSRTAPSFKERLLKEIALLGFLLLAGIVLLPVAIYLVGQVVFGAYGGRSFAVFYGQLNMDFRAGEPAAVFLLLSPCVIWQLLRLTVWLFRRGANRPVETS